MRIYLAITALLALIAAPGAASADELELVDGVRSDKRFLVGASPVDAFQVVVKDAAETLPMPTLRFSLQVAAQTSLDLGVGALPRAHDLYVMLGHLGVRRFLGDEPFAPYLLARAGAFYLEDDENPDGDRIWPFAAAGGGLEYTHASGFSVWAELALAAIRIVKGGDDPYLAPSIYGNAGVGYRFAGLGG